MLAIFDIVNGGPATILTMSSLGAYDFQYNLQVSPDGRSLLLNAYYDNYIGYDILVFDISANPKSPALLATITGNVPGSGPPVLVLLIRWSAIGCLLWTSIQGRCWHSTSMSRTRTSANWRAYRLPSELHRTA